MVNDDLAAALVHAAARKLYEHDRAGLPDDYDTHQARYEDRARAAVAATLRTLGDHYTVEPIAPGVAGYSIALSALADRVESEGRQ